MRLLLQGTWTLEITLQQYLNEFNQVEDVRVHLERVTKILPTCMHSIHVSIQYTDREVFKI